MHGAQGALFIEVLSKLKFYKILFDVTVNL
jgi:hypothetical protein